MATMNDVAAKAGVSQATVSYVLNNRHEKLRISEKTRQRILAVADELNYCRDARATMMKTGGTNVVAYVDNMMGRAEYSGIILSSLMEECARRKRYVKLFSLDDNRESVAILFEERPSGVVCRSVSPAAHENLLNYGESHGVPVLSLSRQTNHRRGVFLTPDDLGRGRQAFDCFTRLGHQNIGLVASGDVGFRERGFIDAARQAGRPIPDANILRLCGHGPERLPDIRDFLSAAERPTALFAVTDYHAFRVMQAAWDLEIAVPRDLSLIGVGGLSAGEYTTPTLTTIAVKGELGRFAADKLFEMVENKDTTYQESRIETCATEIIHRGSTAEFKRKELG